MWCSAWWRWCCSPCRCGTPGSGRWSRGAPRLLSADAQRLTEVFRRSGAEGLKSFIDERVGLQIPGERILLVTDSEYRPLAGNLSDMAPQTCRRRQEPTPFS